MTHTVPLLYWAYRQTCTTSSHLIISIGSSVSDEITLVLKNLFKSNYENYAFDSLAISFRREIFKFLSTVKKRKLH